MARLGPENDLKRLKAQLEDQGTGIATRLVVDGDRLVFRVDGIPADELEQPLTVICASLPSLFTRRVRLMVSDRALLSAVLTEVKDRVEKPWKIRRREGTEYVDLMRPDVQPHAPVGPLHKHTKSHREPVAGGYQSVEWKLRAISGVHIATDLIGLGLALVLAAPLLAAYYRISMIAVRTLGSDGLVISGGLFLILAAALLIIVRLVGRVLRPDGIHLCDTCGTVNRVLPLQRTAAIECSCCGSQLRGVWPMRDLQSVICVKCRVPNAVAGPQLVEGVPLCASCGHELATTANFKARSS